MAWSPLQEIATLDQAKQHLNFDVNRDDQDDDMSLKLFIAHEMVFDYLTQRVSEADEWEATVDTWTAETAPKRVIGAILAQFGFLYRRRGDDNERSTMAEGSVLCPEAEALVRRLRDPAIS